jgi:hypothetical protein
MYSIECSYYKKQFELLKDLINDLIVSGMDMDYDVTYNGITTWAKASDFVIP